MSRQMPFPFGGIVLAANFVGHFRVARRLEIQPERVKPRCPRGEYWQVAEGNNDWTHFPIMYVRASEASLIAGKKSSSRAGRVGVQLPPETRHRESEVSHSETFVPRLLSCHQSCCCCNCDRRYEFECERECDCKCAMLHNGCFILSTLYLVHK